MKKEYYPEINIARGLGVLIVLLGHSFPDAEIGVFAHPVYRWGFDTCYSFHMALFFAISGFVMGGRFFRGDYDVVREIVGKVKRLLIPYLFLSYLSLLPKILLNAYARNPVDTGGAVLVLFGQSPNGSLWYLYVLFVFSVFALCCGMLLRNAGDGWKMLCMTAGGILCYTVWLLKGESVLASVYMERICKYLIFYAAGLVMFRYYERVKKVYYLPVAIGTGGLVLLIACPYTAITVDYGITAILGTYSVLVLAERISAQKESGICRALKRCGDHSYDIYILSYYVQQSIRVLCFRLLRWDYLPVFLMELLLGFAVSYLFSVYVLRKNRTLKRVLIGVWED